PRPLRTFTPNQMRCTFNPSSHTIAPPHTPLTAFRSSIRRQSLRENYRQREPCKSIEKLFHTRSMLVTHRNRVRSSTDDLEPQRRARALRMMCEGTTWA